MTTRTSSDEQLACLVETAWNRSYAIGRREQAHVLHDLLMDARRYLGERLRRMAERVGDHAHAS